MGDTRLLTDRVTTVVDRIVRLAKVIEIAVQLPQTHRSDAVENRERILAAASEMFAAEGLGVPMREVARRAEVSPATLYRHVPTKEALATEAFRDEMRACHAILDEGLAHPDPWRGFCLALEGVCEHHARNRDFTSAFMAAFPEAMDFTAERRQSLGALGELSARATRAGQLRSDIAIDDLVLMLMANRGLRAGSPAFRIAASRRLAALAIQAFRAPAASSESGGSRQ